jgi:hypothetical protein
MKNSGCLRWKEVLYVLKIIFLQLLLFLVGHLREYNIQDNQETINNSREETIPKLNRRDHCWIREKL